MQKWTLISKIGTLVKKNTTYRFPVPYEYGIKNGSFFAVSHTTDDLVFIWDPQMPLDVDKGIELPQLELISTKNDDCTTEYSTGKSSKYKNNISDFLNKGFFHEILPLLCKLLCAILSTVD